jgi:hypothetical protein
MGRTHVERSPTECDLQTSTMGRPRPTRAVEPEENIVLKTAKLVCASSEIIRLCVTYEC